MRRPSCRALLAALLAAGVASEAPVSHRKEQMPPLRFAPLVDELRRLAPEVNVSGGSFAHWLPHPATISPIDRAVIRERAEQEATGRCLTVLLASAGLPAIEPRRLASGARDWPTGYSGSVSHKGTTVVAALVSAGQARSLGIDIETRDGAAELSTIKGLSAVDELPPDWTSAGPVILFSVKEAVFKALHPVIDRRLRFEDIAVSWTDIRSSRCLLGIAHCGCVSLDIRCSIVVPGHVASVALLPAAATAPSA